MKKLAMLFVLVLVLSCSNDETIKEIEVIKEVPVEVPVIVDNTAPNTILKTENWLKSHNSGYGSVDAFAVLKVEIKKTLDEGNGYQFFNIYIGDHRHDRNDIPQMAGYGYENTVIVVFFKNNHSQEIRIYEPSGDNNLKYRNDLTIKQPNYTFAADFFKNEFIGSMTIYDFTNLK